MLSLKGPSRRSKYLYDVLKGFQAKNVLALLSPLYYRYGTWPKIFKVLFKIGINDKPMFSTIFSIYDVIIQNCMVRIVEN